MILCRTCSNTLRTALCATCTKRFSSADSLPSNSNFFLRVRSLAPCTSESVLRQDCANLVATCGDKKHPASSSSCQLEGFDGVHSAAPCGPTGDFRHDCARRKATYGESVHEASLPCEDVGDWYEISSLRFFNGILVMSTVSSGLLHSSTYSGVIAGWTGQASAKSKAEATQQGKALRSEIGPEPQLLRSTEVQQE